MHRAIETESVSQDIGYFYDTIHGRVNFADLRPEFEPALKKALSSRALDRLTRITQLGHTSLTYFSATQTRFSRAIGTLLMMNKLCLHVWGPRQKPLPVTLSKELEELYLEIPGWSDSRTFVECHLTRPAPAERRIAPDDQEAPDKVFFDLLLDHDAPHKSYTPETIRVESHVTRQLNEPVPLEHCSGALTPLFLDTDKINRVPLVRNSFLLFASNNATTDDRKWLARARHEGWLFDALDRADVQRELPHGDSTWNKQGYRGPRLAISCSFKDRETVVRLVHALDNQRQQYRILLDSLLWLDGTPRQNSQTLIDDAEAALIVASVNYLESARTSGSIIDAETSVIRQRSRQLSFKVVVVSVDPRDALNQVKDWSWTAISDRFATGMPIVPDGLRNAGKARFEEVAIGVVDAVRDTHPR